MKPGGNGGTGNRRRIGREEVWGGFDQNTLYAV